MTSRDEMLGTRNNGSLNLEIQGDYKIVIDCYDRKDNIPNSSKILTGGLWKLTQELNIYKCYHSYREANRTTDFLANKGICKVVSMI